MPRCHRGELGAVFYGEDCKGEGKAAVLGDYGAEGDTVETDALPAAKSKRENNAAGDIYKIDHQVGEHAAYSVLHADEPAFYGHEAQSGRGRPHANEKVPDRKFGHTGSPVSEKHGEAGKRPLKEEQQHCKTQRKGYAMHQQGAALAEHPLGQRGGSG